MKPSNRQRFASLLVAASVLGAAQAPAVAHAGELIVEGRINTTFITDTSFDALSNENHVVGTWLGVGYDLGAYVLPGFRAYVLLDSTGLSRERFNGALSMDWSRQVLMAAADYGPDLWGFFRPSVRVGAGWATQSLTLASANPSVHDRTHDLAATAALGFELYVPYTNDPAGPPLFNTITFGLGGHFGYMAQTTANFNDLRADDDAYADSDPWQRAGSNFGELDIDGLYWNLGLVVRFLL
ncbi:MAG: hypothetical protein H0U74_18930 [Bradymonadaceae bacterium]|nr:hypothetical protein [Lujinxingiaceae bacterium]